ncbi:MAG TPA: DUF924 family protein [Burkholderiales bacterium]|nr:DUF924 family protein [Burkholderiales bacterium]
MQHDWQRVLDFWFGTADMPGYGQPRPEWFRKSDAFDETIRERFESTYEAAARGELVHWQDVPESALALVIVLDQFPRNMYRGTPRAFAADPLALSVARHIVAQGWDRSMKPVERLFVYLPYEHAEDMAMQRESVRLFETLRDDPQSVGGIDYAWRHYEIIERFGRFPHRNAILGRPSTPEEIEFLKQPGSSF